MKVKDTAGLALRLFIQNDFPQAVDYNPTISPRIQKLLNKVTHKNMQQRFQSCKEFELELRGRMTRAVDNNHTLSIGRENCDINIPHQKVSRHHADINIMTQSGHTKYLFQDRSSNGTVIDRMDIHNGEIEIIPQNHPVILLAGIAELPWDAVEEALRKREVHGSPAQMANSSTIPINPPVYQQAPIPANPPQSPPVRVRHGFTTFWLWLALIANFAIGAFLFYLENFVTVALSVAGVIAIIMILCWKKWGFWAFIGIKVLMIIAFMIYWLQEKEIYWMIFFMIYDLTNFMIYRLPEKVIFLTITSTVILFGVLLLRNAHGVNTWEQLR